MARVFSAVDITSEELLDQLESTRDRLDLGFNPVARDKMHITLEFFEDVNEDEVEKLKKAMENVSLDDFRLEVTGVGAFPSKDYIRVVWAGAEDRKMHQLYSQVSDHSVESSNNHDFAPHITLMRVENISKGDKRKLRKVLDEHQGHWFGEATVGAVKLFESKLTGKGSKYSELYRKEL